MAAPSTCWWVVAALVMAAAPRPAPSPPGAARRRARRCPPRYTSSKGRLQRTCTSEVGVNKCEGACNSQVQPSITTPTGFLKGSGTAVMDFKNILLKTEADYIPIPSGSMMFEDLPAGSSHSDGTEEEPQLRSEIDVTEHKIDVHTECPIPECDQLNIKKEEVLLPEDFHLDYEPLHIKDEKEIISSRCASDTKSFIQVASKSSRISFIQATITDELEMDVEKSTYVTCDTQTQDNLSQDYSCSPRDNYHLRKHEFQEFTCSSCEQGFSSKYCLIMHVFTHIDGVKPPKYICMWCGSIYLASIGLNNHLKLCEHRKTPHTNNMLQTYCSKQESHNSHAMISSVGVRFNSDKKGQPTSRVDNGLTHRAKCTRKRSHKCDICSKAFVSASALKYHSVVHTGERPYECNVCGKTFGIPSSLKIHLIVHTGERRHKCNICNKSFGRLGSLKSHKLIHTAERPYKCQTCDKYFKSTSSLQKHKLVHTDYRPHKCNVCGKAFRRPPHLRIHLMTHTGERPYKCNVCSKSFTAPSSLRTHTVVHTRNRFYICDVCGKSYTRSSHLKIHALIHTGKRAHECKVCGKAFYEKGALKLHAVLHTAPKPVHCVVCGKFFPRINYLKAHSVIHIRGRAYKCDVCGRGFTTSRYLKLHERLHTDDPLKCDVCGKTFTNNKSLKEHAVIHTGKGTHKCNVCGKLFTAARSATTHALLHTGQRNYKCDTCGMSFFRKDTLKSHVLRHIDEK